MQLLDIELSAFPHASPKNRATFAMDFEHVLFGFLPRVSEDTLEHHCDVGHQVDRIIVYDYLPRKIDILL